MNFLIQDHEPATTVKPGNLVVVVSSIAEKQEHGTNAGEGKDIFQCVDDLEEIKQPVDDEEYENLGDDGTLYGISKFEKVEDVEYYTDDGFHPVSIGDNFKDGKYRIVHKLGNGAFATVWLARDVEEKSYVAIKIALADFSKKFSDVSLKIFGRIQEYIDRGKSAKFIDLPIENFWVDGPNGRHFCTVSRFLGPSITAVTQNKCYVDAKSCQRMALQLTQTLAILHSAEMEIVHGDLTSANVLLELESIDSWSVEKLYEELGAPNGDRVCAYNGRVLGSEAPKFLYEAADLTRLLGRRTGNIRVIDFGESFFVDNTPEEGVGTPEDFRSPELLLENKCGKGSDIWALALTVFELRLQSRLFRSFVFPDSEVLTQIHNVLGTPPAHLEGSKRLNEISPRQDGQNLRDSTKTLRDKINQIKAAQNVNRSGKDVGISIDEEEADQFVDLLSSALKYDLKERFTADDMLRHPWFSMCT